MNDFEKIVVKGIDFPIRTITIFEGTSDQRTIKVATIALLEFLEINETSEDLLNPDYLSLDNQISCYVEPEQFNFSEEKLINLIETEYYG